MRRLSGTTVYKPFNGTDWQFTAAQRLSAEGLRYLECVSYAPVIFQEEIRKCVDIRVTVIDDDVFATEIRSERGDAPLDWRSIPLVNTLLTSSHPT